MPDPTAMVRTFGSMPTTMPEGFFKAVRFPVLAKLDQQTGDRRMLLSDGADVRALPLSIKFATKTSAMGGHDGAEVSGTLFTVTLDPANGNMSGEGFLLNDDNGRRHARLIHTGAMKGNSVDLAEVRARLVEDFDTGEYWIEFYKFSLAATTGVSTPAFAEAHAEVDPLSGDELMASFMVDPMEPLIVQEPDEFDVVVLGAPVEELIAAAGAPFDAFYRPESDIPHKIIVDADLDVYGHVALWESCWSDDLANCTRPPRPTDGYASFNQPGVLTDRGIVSTGPIFALGGHRSVKSAPTMDQAYGGIENTWCDVRVTEGKHGPWLSGRVRPGTPDDMIYAARASRISGHWVNGNLRAIVSVNVPAFNVAGTDEEIAAAFSFTTEQVTHDDGTVVDEITELVASFPECVEPESDQLTIAFSSTEELSKALTLLTATTAGSPWFVASPTSTGTFTVTHIEVGPEIEAHQPTESGDGAGLRQWNDEKLAVLLEDDDEADS